jgi:hypothetical protein
MPLLYNLIVKIHKMKLVWIVAIYILIIQEQVRLHLNLVHPQVLSLPALLAQALFLPVVLFHPVLYPQVLFLQAQAGVLHQNHLHLPEAVQVSVHQAVSQVRVFQAPVPEVLHLSAPAQAVHPRQYRQVAAEVPVQSVLPVPDLHHQYQVQVLQSLIHHQVLDLLVQFHQAAQNLPAVCLHPQSHHLQVDHLLLPQAVPANQVQVFQVLVLNLHLPSAQVLPDQVQVFQVQAVEAPALSAVAVLDLHPVSVLAHRKAVQVNLPVL